MITCNNCPFMQAYESAKTTPMIDAGKNKNADNGCLRAKGYTTVLYENNNSTEIRDRLVHLSEKAKYVRQNAQNFAKALMRLNNDACRQVQNDGPQSDFNKPLSVRECEILHLTAKGMTNSTISKELSISQNTVKSHFDHIFTKLGVTNRTMAVVWALREGLL